MTGELEPFGDTPLHIQLADVLRRMIKSGQLAPLDKLPSEHDLQERYGVSRGTVRHALRTLADEGMIFTIPARGSHVGPRPAPGSRKG